ncbi:MAG: uroporphyrinogen-III C-methyltransferase [Azoarcus sp.]|jgi:uroporphyrin-3 C-methyltransferase|nr:uroporphyrinogen-III C-methyltransferase [Azoarcus sp.]
MNLSTSSSTGSDSGNTVPEAAPDTPATLSAPDSPATENPSPALPPRHDAPFAPAPRSGVAGWALLLALLSLGLAVHTLWQSREWHIADTALHREFGGKLAENKASATETQALVQQVAGIQGRLASIDAKVERSEGQAMALEDLYQQFSRSREDHLIAEVRQAVTIASQQLQYAGNVETALIVLRGAQARLEQNDHGQFAPLRRTLAADIEKLGQQGNLDIPETALRLEHLLAKVDALPLAYMSGVPAAPPSSEPAGAEDADIAGFALAILHSVWNELRSLVKIERIDAEAEPGLLAPAQSAFLRENLKIRLLTARLALLARDGHTYAADLAQARNWIERFFDIQDADVKKAIDDLRALEAMPVGVKRYELIESLAALRSLEAPRGRAGNGPPSAPLQDGGARAAEDAPAAVQP